MNPRPTFIPAIRVAEDAHTSVTLIDGRTPEGRAALRAWSAPRPGERKPAYDLLGDLTRYAAAVAEVNAEMAARPVLRSAAEVHALVAQRVAARKAVA